MHIPEPIPTDVHDETFAGVTYHIRGQLVPELQIELSSGPVMFEHHVLLWKEPAVKIELRKLPGGRQAQDRRPRLLRHRALGPGRIAFSRDSAGQCIPLHLAQGESLNVREHQFIAATDTVEYSFERVQGIRNMLLGGSGFFIDNFRANHGDAIVWVHGTGTCSSSRSTRASRSTSRPAAGSTRTRRADGGGRDGAEDGLLGGGGKMTWNRFTGPGRLAIQTMYIAPLEGSRGRAPRPRRAASSVRSSVG